MTGVTDQDPKRLARALERETEELEGQSAELEARIEETRQDWERKRADENVPGAPPREEPRDAPDAS